MTPSPSAQQPGDRTAAWQPLVHPDAPPPKGAYTPAIRAGDLVFVSGQVPRDPVTGELQGDDVRTQTHATLRNVERALGLAGASLADVVSMTVYLVDVDEWDAFDAAYREIMQPPFPTRTTIGVAIRGIRIEISAVAYVGGRP